jgi:hypothetical protein
MIGGHDITIPTLSGAKALRLGVRASMLLWPDAVVVDAASGDVLADLAVLSSGRYGEVLVYRDKIAAQKWEELGADDTLLGTMIHFLMSDRSLTIVVDDNPSAPMTLLVDVIREAVSSPEEAESAVR